MSNIGLDITALSKATLSSDLVKNVNFSETEDASFSYATKSNRIGYYRKTDWFWFRICVRME